MKHARRLLGLFALLVVAGCSGPSATNAQTAMSGVIVLMDGKEMLLTYDSIRKSEVFVAGRTEFSYNHGIPEFRIVHYDADGKMRSTTRLNRVEKNRFAVRRALPDGKVILEEISFSGYNWIYHSMSAESEYTLRGSSLAVAGFLSSDRTATPLSEK